jgi:hypothetical protein
MNPMYRLLKLAAVIALTAPLNSCEWPPNLGNKAKFSFKEGDIIEWNDPALAQVKQDQDIKFYVAAKPLSYTYQSTQLTAEAIVYDKAPPIFAKNLSNELSLYPRQTLRALGIKKILIVENLKINGQSRNAMPFFGIDVMLYSIELQRTSPGEIPHIVHHEIFHMADYKDDREVYNDPNWLKLNSSEFKYRSGGVNMRNAGVGVWQENTQGFLNEYSTSGLEEDKAEVFAGLMWKPTRLDSLSQNDQILRNKIEYIKAVLQNISPAFSSQFWTEIAQKRDAFQSKRDPNDPYTMAPIPDPK